MVSYPPHPPPHSRPDLQESTHLIPRLKRGTPDSGIARPRNKTRQRSCIGSAAGRTWASCSTPKKTFQDMLDAWGHHPSIVSISPSTILKLHKNRAHRPCPIWPKHRKSTRRHPARHAQGGREALAATQAAVDECAGVAAGGRLPWRTSVSACGVAAACRVGRTTGRVGFGADGLIAWRTRKITKTKIIQN